MKKKRVYKIVMSFLITGLLFAGLLLFEKSKRPEQIMRTVVTARQEIPEGICLTEENLDSYVEKKSVEEKNCHGDNVKETAALLGMKAKIPLKKGTVLQKEWFLDTENIEEQMENPVRVSVRAEDLSHVLAGSLRQGDFINLYFYDEETAAASLMFRGVLVTEAYDNTGKVIEKGDRERAAAMLTLLFEEEDVEKLCELIAEGSFRMAEAKNRTEPYERLEEEVHVENEKEDVS